MQKMRFSEEKKKSQLKKKSPQRPSIVSNYSFVSLSEVTEGSLQVWRTLPEKIRQDPSLASFRQEHERLHGESMKLFFRFIFGASTSFLVDDVVHLTWLSPTAIRIDCNNLLNEAPVAQQFFIFLSTSTFQISFLCRQRRIPNTRSLLTRPLRFISQLIVIKLLLSRLK